MKCISHVNILQLSQVLPTNDDFPSDDDGSCLVLSTVVWIGCAFKAVNSSLAVVESNLTG